MISNVFLSAFGLHHFVIHRCDRRTQQYGRGHRILGTDVAAENRAIVPMITCLEIDDVTIPSD
jgi:hypothetical protein